MKMQMIRFTPSFAEYVTIGRGPYNNVSQHSVTQAILLPSHTV